MNYKATLCDITMHAPYDSRDCKFTDRDPRNNTEVMGVSKFNIYVKVYWENVQKTSC